MLPLCCRLLVFLFSTSVLCEVVGAERHPPDDPLQSPSDEEETMPQPSSDCSSSGLCQRERQSSTLDDGELRRVRIEAIKQRILQKLRLKAPPQVRLQRRGLPSVLLSNSDALLQSDEVDTNFSDSRKIVGDPLDFVEDDDFYGTTKNVFVFPDNTTASRVQCSHRSSVCLIFRLASEVFSGNLASSHIWLYKQKATNSPNQGTSSLSNQTLVVSEIVYDRQFGILRKRILALEDEDIGRSAGGWVRFRVDRAVRRWVTKPHLVHALEISCKGCGHSPVPLSQEIGQQPFLVLTVGPQASLSRRRRDLDCTNTTTRCCRESFYLSFKEIGWDEWILQPPGYTANFCRGSCLIDVSTSRYHHTTVLARYLVNLRAKNEDTSFSLCCTPSKMSSISLIYIDEDESIFQKSLPNMVVEACDCA